MKVAMLTSGGDCQGLNACLRGVARTLYNEKGDAVELYGIRDGYRGLIEGDWQQMKPEEFSGILRQGGTILGTSRRPFKEMQLPAENGDRLTKMVEHYKKGGFDALVILGGNGTHKSAHLLHQSGVNLVTLPKTIDNDIYGTDLTFGFDSAVDKATIVIDALHSTAESHGRVFVVELMGHKVGWITLCAGIAGGADVILLPEIPYSPEKVAEVIERRNRLGKNFSIVAVAEGALSNQEAALPKKERKSLLEGGGSAGLRVAQALTERLGQEVRATIPGHFQRGGDPTPTDRLFCSRLGAAAGELILQKRFGYMVGLRGSRITPVPLEEVASRLKAIPTDNEILHQARLLGISLGE